MPKDSITPEEGQLRFYQNSIAWRHAGAVVRLAGLEQSTIELINRYQPVWVRVELMQLTDEDLRKYLAEKHAKQIEQLRTILRQQITWAETGDPIALMDLEHCPVQELVSFAMSKLPARLKSGKILPGEVQALLEFFEGDEVRIHVPEKLQLEVPL